MRAFNIDTDLPNDKKIEMAAWIAEGDKLEAQHILQDVIRDYYAQNERG